MLVTGTPAAGQDAPAPDAEPLDAVEAFLERHDLQTILSTYLLDELREARGGRRAEVAERLGRHYAQRLAEADTAEERRELQARSRELLELVPDADSFELRITLHKATFLIAEETAQRFVLRLAEDAEVSEAIQTLRGTAAEFHEIGRRIDGRVEAFENLESRATEGDIAYLREQLADARRLRSLAMYYAGWSQYYTALMTSDPRQAENARRSFGWLLNAPGNREPSLESMPTTLFRYEHVARSAMACAMSHAVAGQDVIAVQWLDAIAGAAETPPAVLDELHARRIEVLGRARRWSDLQRLVDRRRLGADPVGATPLPVGEARLVAVTALEALADPGSIPAAGRDRLLEALAQVALGDLVSAGEIGHVLDLVRRFGTTPMGDSGFVVLYVRGLRAYERARETHAASGGGDEPTDDVSVANRYLDAVRALEIAEVASDAARFPPELVQARMMRGLALYYAGKLDEAAAAFEEVFERAQKSELREESLWYAIVSLDRAVEAGRRSLAEERDRLATVYLQTFPATDRSAKLLLRRVDDGLLSQDQAIAVLLEVPADSPLYTAARRHASRLLYRKYRATRSNERDYVAARFVEIAEELIDLDVRQLRNGSAEEAGEAGRLALLRIRQALDALLSISVPDVSRAERLLEMTDDIAAASGADLTDIRGELAYRRLQIALERGDQIGIDRATAQLEQAGGPHARSADRLLYRRAVDGWRSEPSDAIAARRVVNRGARVLTQFEPIDERGSDTTVVGLLDTIAEAATAAWRASGDVAMRDVAIETDKRLLGLGRQSADSLRRLAVASEDSGDLDTAIDAWRTLLSGLRDGSAGWFEARVESIRVLTRIDRGRALQVLEQHRTLYPEYGPEPWGGQLRELERTLGPVGTGGGDGG